MLVVILICFIKELRYSQKDKSNNKAESTSSASDKASKEKLSYKETKALEVASTQMEQLSEELAKLETEIADPELLNVIPSFFKQRLINYLK